jgi:hypothetical protein
MARNKKPKSVKHKKITKAIKLDNPNSRVELSETKLKQWIIKAVEMLKDNFPASYIRQYIALNKQGVVSEDVINRIMHCANAEISNEYFNKQSQVISIHSKRYSKQLKKLLAVEELPQDKIDSAEEGGISYEDWMKSREKKIKSCYQTLETMFQKERVLGIHNKNFNFNINTEETIKEVTTKKSVPKLDNLTFDEMVEYYELMMLAKEDENEMISVKIVNQETKVDVTEDIEAEVIEQANVELIKQETPPEVNIVKPLDNFDPTARLRESLAKIAAEKLKGAGANLDIHEQKHLNQE